ncbi:MAG TPA: cytochrome c peroxidase [Bacteroidia bacterium]|nr:cytochrome c peroxidase [Bacteroidia bacterium]
MKNSILPLTLLLFLIGTFGTISCTKDKEETPQPETPFTPTAYSLRVPAGWPTPVIPEFNKMTVEGVRLGRMLFYDNILSMNGRSCSSCHHADKSYSTPIFINTLGESISVPPLINVAWNPDFEWYAQVPVLDHVPLGDFTPEFFDSNMDTIVARIKAHPLYPQYFYEAFNIKDVAAITADELKLKCSYAMIQFVRTIITDNSKFDKVMRHETAFSPEEMAGSMIYYTEAGDCFHCHGTPLLTNNVMTNNGLDTVFVGDNLGYYNVTGRPTDIGKFSAPTLRNVELTAPYMHDGRFQTLEEVVEFYNSGVHWTSPNIDPIMTKPFKEYGLMLTAQDKANLIAFLKTFTDTTIIHNPDYLSPF